MKQIAPLGRINIFNSSEFRDRINELINAVNEMGGGASAEQLSATEDAHPSNIPVRLTAQSATAGRWEFVEVLWDDPNSQWIDRTNGLTHDDLGEAMPTGGPAAADQYLAKVNDIVYLFPSEAFKGDVAIFEFQPPPKESFWAKITGNSSDGDNKWTYSFTEQTLGSSGWSDTENGRTGTDAVNSAEANNSASGIQGNSVDLDGQIFTDNSDLEVQPVQGEPVVRMWVDADDEGNALYAFQYENAIDGECD